MIDPLVTIGIPTYNRPTSLARTLAAMCNQTYRNLEIIVSDNASTDPSVEKVVRDVMAGDSRVVYHRHSQNVGATANFSSLVSKGTGELFMWAADDDRWETFFVEKCARELVSNPSLAVCQMEAQYEVAPGTLFPFFFEGSAFHRPLSGSPPERVKQLLRHVYGNLVYGVFRREALFHNGRPVTEWVGRTLNEIPMEVLFVSRGGICVLPEIGMYKSAPKTVCEQAMWEQCDGRLPNWMGWRAHISGSQSLHRYHSMVLQETCVAIDDLGYDKHTTRRLRAWAAFCLFRHELYLAMRWKPRLASCGTR
jgi:glycosyltransferase involved in cell wall biosynthesis